MKRSDVIKLLMDQLRDDDLVLTATGMITRETFVSHNAERNFYIIGSMGLISSIGLGVALHVPDRRVVLLDGDGSILMDMGSVAMIAAEAPANLYHVVLDNQSYESTGNQPSISDKISLGAVAQSCGYANVFSVNESSSCSQVCGEFLQAAGPAFLHVSVSNEGSPGIARVNYSPEQITQRFRAVVSGEA